ncbi:hypothetical protein FTV88_1429 [Heliorestis convoluta]|uniref:Uncharacterized protein n=1 Tax=Heliorestis convoluta TaxID=356322 RepID=A0A5Q2N1T3_9FIRM|nr:hypothetical protein FTV88_1429 [Heliorestis convoluta]
MFSSNFHQEDGKGTLRLPPSKPLADVKGKKVRLLKMLYK